MKCNLFLTTIACVITTRFVHAKELRPCAELANEIAALNICSKYSDESREDALSEIYKNTYERKEKKYD